MHTNPHKKDELCIKTYFLHKKPPLRVSCRGGKNGLKNCLNLYVPIPKGIDEPAKEVITSFSIL